MSAGQPKKIYRYQSISARTIESLCNDTLYFADPTAFNDPLDCKPTVVSDSDNATLRMILAELIKRRVAAETRAALRKARLQGEKAEAHANRSGEQAAERELANIAYNATDPEFEVSKEKAECWLLTSEIQREILKQYDRGVCCFSTAADNPLLWSHYADKHQGVCIGYGLARVPKPKLQKVIYGGSRSVRTSLIAHALFDNDQEAQNLLDRDVLLRKAPSWRYERECRLLTKDRKRGFVMSHKLRLRVIEFLLLVVFHSPAITLLQKATATQSDLIQKGPAKTMPYIKQERRQAILSGAEPQDAGELNFAITIVVDKYLQHKGGLRYAHINEVVGAMECAKLELYRRIAVPYEDQKIKESGDVYKSSASEGNLPANAP